MSTDHSLLRFQQGDYKNIYNYVLKLYLSITAAETTTHSQKKVFENRTMLTYPKIFANPVMRDDPYLALKSWNLLPSTTCANICHI